MICVNDTKKVNQNRHGSGLRKRKKEIIRRAIHCFLRPIYVCMCVSLAWPKRVHTHAHTKTTAPSHSTDVSAHSALCIFSRDLGHHQTTATEKISSDNTLDTPKHQRLGQFISGLPMAAYCCWCMDKSPLKRGI